MAFSTPIESIVTNIWDRHLASDQHFGRIRAFMSTKLDMLGFSESTSTYTVKPFNQQDPSRKVTWQWNAKDRTHEFVLNVIGLEDLVERRSIAGVEEKVEDFFCRLCAVLIPRRSAALEAHVRSAQHVLCYVHKYHPLTIMELDCLPKEGGKEMRKILAQLLKDHQLKEQYCIPVYDPVGEQERKTVVAVQKAKDEERQRHLAEARQKAQEQRKKKDEERRKQRELEMEKEKQRQEERARREKDARERAKRLEEEKARVKKLLVEAARKAEEEKKAKEAKEKAQEEADRQKRQEHLRSLLDREKARLRALHEKEAAQRRLLVEKQELEKKMKELQERAALKNQPPQVAQGQHPLRNGPSSYANIPEPQLIAPNMRPSSTGLVNVSPEPYRQPLLGHAPQFMHNGPHHPVPPPSMSYNGPPSMGREAFETAGPKPLFPKFVPIAEQVPVYKGLEDAEKATRPKPKTPPPEERPKVISRPSLFDRRVDPYISNAKIIQTRDQLVDFIWRQGAERIPPSELPVQFNEKAAGIEGALGVDCLYEVVCADCSDLDTLYCSMCGVWTFPNEMFKHLETVEHKLAYLFRNYKMYHQTVVSETNSIVREAMLSQFAIQIWKMEKPPGQVCNRLRSLLDRATIERIWPEYVNVLDHSWKDSGRTVGRVEVPPPISKEAWCIPTDDKAAEDKKIKEKKIKEEIKDEKEKGNEKSSKTKGESRDKSDSRSKRKDDKEKEKDKKESSSSIQSRKRSASPEKKSSSSSKPHESRRSASPHRKRRRSRSPDKDSRTRSPSKRSRSRSPDKRSRARSPEKHSSRDDKHSHERSSSRSKRDRRRSSSREYSRRSRSRSRSRSPRHRRRRSRSRSRGRRSDNGLSWEETAAAFLAKLGDAQAAAKVLDSAKEKKSSKRASSKSFVDEKIKQLRSLANPTPSSSSKEKVDTERAKPSSSSDSDEKVQMRKLLGVLITMQQEAERNGNLDESIIDKLYREVGLKKSVEASSDQLLAQICSQISQDSPSSSKPAIDLQSFGISTQPQPVPQQPAPSIFGGGFNTQPMPPPGQPSTIQSLLSEVKRSLGTLKPPRPPSPLVKSPPFVITKRDDVFPDAETISYVFPGADSKEIRQASSSNTPPAEDKLSKKEKAALRRKMLLEEAERLRRQAEEEGEDDDDEWDCLAEVINNPPPTNKVNTVEQPSARSHHKSQDQKTASQEKSQDRRSDEKEKSHSRKSDDKGRSHDRRSDDREKSHDRRASEKEKEDSKRASDSKRSSSQREEEPREKKLDPIAPGQKMPLQRTILPDGKPSREAKKEEAKARAKEKKEEREKSQVKGVPSHWPQPVPQPLLGLSLERPPQKEEPRQPMRQEPFQPHPQQFPMHNEPVYPPMGNNPVYPNQYPPMYPNQQPPFQNPPYYPGQQFMGQPPMNGFGGPPMQQQFYGHPPYY
ncbi:hypothetical protein Y032_0266g731 [Ancylostoma ceylanicum]|uniref:Uncharacterized protein n=1 Tax=Ancylostoma ceylanicum TaxID=53326 RepID=A0A016SA47_9BILA|nr:hypothetical protein Y032_0266g731 [Ancylostoma ceylanicum]